MSNAKAESAADVLEAVGKAKDALLSAIRKAEAAGLPSRRLDNLCASVEAEQRQWAFRWSRYQLDGKRP
jgi:hypothetical protein